MRPLCAIGRKPHVDRSHRGVNSASTAPASDRRVAPGHPPATPPDEATGRQQRQRRVAARTAAAVLVLAGAALAAWQGTLSRSSATAHVAVLATVAAAFAAALLAGHGRQRTPSGAWFSASWHAVAGWRRAPRSRVAGVIGWIVLGVATVGWDLNSFLHQSHDLPTLSSLIGHVTGVSAGRGLLFAVWLVLGAAVVVVGRRARRDDRPRRSPPMVRTP